MDRELARDIDIIYHWCSQAEKRTDKCPPAVQRDIIADIEHVRKTARRLRRRLVGDEK